MRMKKQLAVLSLCCAAVFCGAEKKEEPAWVISAARFTLNDVPEQYTSYASAVPEMLNLLCSVPVERMVSGDEKKARKLMDIARKKLALIKERTALIRERDGLYLAVMPEAEKAKKTAAVNKRITAKETEIAKMEEKRTAVLAGTVFLDEKLPVRLWQEGKKVFEQPEHTDLAQALDAEKISAVITGRIQDLSGYMHISATLTTGIPGLPEYSFVEAGRYDAVEALTQSLALQILETLRSAKTAAVSITVEPEGALVYLDNEAVDAGKKSIRISEGVHRIEALAPEYETATKTIEAAADTDYVLTIKLKKESVVSIAFSFKEPLADVFLHTKYFGSNPFQMEIPAGKDTIVSFSYGDVKTYTVIHYNPAMQAGQEPYPLQTALNKKRTKTKIERQRNILYWSLGAFYISLPIFMILQGLTADMATAASGQRLIVDSAARQRYRSLFISSAIMQGITIGLGINYAVQLGIYLHAADKSVPREAVSR